MSGSPGSQFCIFPFAWFPLLHTMSRFFGPLAEINLNLYFHDRGTEQVWRHTNTSKRSRLPMHRFFDEHDRPLNRSELVTIFTELWPLRPTTAKNADTLLRGCRCFHRLGAYVQFPAECKELDPTLDLALAFDFKELKRADGLLRPWWAKNRSIVQRVGNVSDFEAILKTAPDWASVAAELKQVLQSKLGSVMFVAAHQTLTITEATTASLAIINEVLDNALLISTDLVSSMREQCKAKVTSMGIDVMDAGVNKIICGYRGLPLGVEVRDYEEAINCLIMVRIKEMAVSSCLQELCFEQEVCGAPCPRETVIHDDVVADAQVARNLLASMVPPSSWANGVDLSSMVAARRKMLKDNDSTFGIEVAIIEAVQGVAGEQLFTNKMFAACLPSKTLRLSLPEIRQKLKTFSESLFAKIVRAGAKERLGTVRTLFEDIALGVAPDLKSMAKPASISRVLAAIPFLVTKEYLMIEHTEKPETVNRDFGRTLFPWWQIEAEYRVDRKILSLEFCSRAASVQHLMNEDQASFLSRITAQQWSAARERAVKSTDSAAVTDIVPASSSSGAEEIGGKLDMFFQF